MSKPALYYHFDSRDALLEAIFRPLIEEGDAFVDRQPTDARPSASLFLSDYFDLLRRHRQVLILLVRDFSTLAALDLGARLLDWRQRLVAALVGPHATLADRVRATVAIGGLSDCLVEFSEVAAEELKATAVDAACGALAGSAGLREVAEPDATAATVVKATGQRSRRRR